MAIKLLAFSGSLREASLNKQLVKQAAEYAKQAGAEVTFIDLRDYEMPHYDGDIEERSGMPQAAQDFKALLKSHHGFLLSTPEYNSALSGVLKNAIDWASRKEEGEEMLEAFSGKTAAIMTASPGGLGGIRGLPILRLILQNIGIHVLPNQVAFGGAHEGFNEDGSIKDEKMAGRVEKMAKELVDFTTKLN